MYRPGATSGTVTWMEPARRSKSRARNWLNERSALLSTTPARFEMSSGASDVSHVTFWAVPVFHTASAPGVRILGDQTVKGDLGVTALEAPWTRKKECRDQSKERLELHDDKIGFLVGLTTARSSYYIHGQ